MSPAPLTLLVAFLRLPATVVPAATCSAAHGEPSVVSAVGPQGTQSTNVDVVLDHDEFTNGCIQGRKYSVFVKNVSTIKRSIQICLFRDHLSSSHRLHWDCGVSLDVDPGKVANYWICDATGRRWIASKAYTDNTPFPLPPEP
jgi:hypothetical protein